jgi:hypothetical protein
MAEIRAVPLVLVGLVFPLSEIQALLERKVSDYAAAG